MPEQDTEDRYQSRLVETTQTVEVCMFILYDAALQ